MRPALLAFVPMLLLLATASVPVGADAPAAARPVAVELFTSQGCSSCPPADAVLARLAKEPDVVAISRPVTYWDQLGWKDTLARQANTDLQRAYARRSGSGRVYTPQAVVQGDRAVVGAQEANIRKLIAAARAKPAPSLAVAAGSVTVSGKRAAPATVSLVALRSDVPVRIGRGENGGRTLRYTNVVVGEQLLGRWTSGTARFAIPPAALRVKGADGYAVIVQQADAGPILAVRKL